jgi:YegS/Rv2252/BmrU family lipid kinase
LPSLAKDVFYKKYLPLFKELFEVEVFETRTVHDAIGLASKCTQRRFDVIVAAGGDGTINQVVNGMLTEHMPNNGYPVLAVLPLGSGNDFARSLELDTSPTAFVERLKKFHVQEIDVGEVYYSVSPHEDAVTSLREKRYFVNVADVGMGPPVVRGVLESGRAFGSAVAYYKSILKTFFTYQPLMLHAKAESWQWSHYMRTFAVANAKYFGNGLCIAPDAVLDDRRFEVFACGPVSVLDFILHSLPLKQGKKIKHKHVSYHTTAQIELSSPSPIEIEADGEIIGWLPATIKLSENRLRFLF